MPTINIRVSKEVKQYLKELAAQEGKTLSAMLRESATTEAHKVLRRYKHRRDDPCAICGSLSWGCGH